MRATPLSLVPSVSKLSLVTFSCLALAVASPSLGDSPPPDPFTGLEIRSVGPVNMTGRVADVEGVPGDPRIVWVGSASGGVFKSTDGGVRFEPVFDDEGVLSIGDVALAPSNPEVVYVGTGEGNPRNSVSFGRGVWKSTDGGVTWTHLGLEKTRYVTRIAVHPSDPDTVYVGALGSIFGPNEERGVFKSTDGGATWEKVLYLDDRHGVADLDLDPRNPNVVFAALWHFDRKPWTHTSGSEEGGVWRSVDGGATWRELTDGLPSLMGRIGVKVAPSNPEVVYVIAESNEGVLFRSEDRGDTFEKVNGDVRLVSRGLYYTDLRVDPVDENRVYAVSSRLFRSIDGGRSFERIARSVHVDFHALWIDPENPRRMWQGQDGGVALSQDRGDTWEAVRMLPLAQFYQVFYDHRQPFYALGGGLQDNGTWVGPSRTREPAGILPDDWRMMSFGDAYFVVPHPEQVDLFLSEAQGGRIVRTDMRTRQQLDVNPQTRRNDGGPVSELEVRFNWNAPIVASPHDPGTVYFAGNVLFETTDFGDTWTRISPDLTTDDEEKQGVAGGPVWVENTTAEWHCTIISVAKSPAAAGTIWAGTDDGKLQLTRDGGETWSDLTATLPVAEFSPVSHVEPSRVDAAIAYVAFDRHMFDDFAPWIFKTTDFGASWTRLGDPARGGGLPAEGWVWVVREDPRNPDVLYAGTEVGLYVSFDRGEAWRLLELSGLPPVSVHDVLVHPRENDLIVGSHGRGIFVFDDATPIQRFTEAEGKAAHLFEVRGALRFPRLITRYGLGDKVMTRPNPPYGALITYFLGEDLATGEKAEAVGQAEAVEVEGEDWPSGEDEAASAGDSAKDGDDAPPPVRLTILGAGGEVLRTLDDPPTTAGLHRVAWDLAMDAPALRDDTPWEANVFVQAPRGPRVLPGTYTVRLEVTTPGGEELVAEQPVRVDVDPLLAIPAGGLEAQQAAAAELTEARSTVNRMLRGLDAVVAEMEARRASAERLERTLPPAFEAAKKQVDELLHNLARPAGVSRWSEGPRLSENLTLFFGDIDEAFRAPSAAQEKFLAELVAETASAADRYDALVTGELVQLGGTLEAAGLAPLALPATLDPSRASVPTTLENTPEDSP